MNLNEPPNTNAAATPRELATQRIRDIEKLIAQLDAARTALNRDKYNLTRAVSGERSVITNNTKWAASSK